MLRVIKSIIFCLMVFNQQVFANPGLLFEVAGVGNPGTVNITLCLNGSIPASCQVFNVTDLNFTVRTVIPNRSYPAVGIKINTPGYEFINAACMPNSKGFCVFSVSSTSPREFFVRNTSSPTVLLYGATGAGSPSNPNSLYQMNTATGLGTFLMNLSDEDGAVIASDGTNIYHWTGYNPLDIFERINLSDLTVTSVPFSGATISEVFGAVFSKTAFIVSDIDNNLFNFTTSGTVTLTGSTADYMRGLACYNHRFYAVTPDSASLYEFNPTTGTILTTKTITLDGFTVTAGLSITANPETGALYALLKVSGTSIRKLVTINKDTGVATLIGDANDSSGDARYSSLAFHPINPDC